MSRRACFHLTMCFFCTLICPCVLRLQFSSGLLLLLRMSPVMSDWRDQLGQAQHPQVRAARSRPRPRPDRYSVRHPTHPTLLMLFTVVHTSLHVLSLRYCHRPRLSPLRWAHPTALSCYHGQQIRVDFRRDNLTMLSSGGAFFDWPIARVA